MRESSGHGSQDPSTNWIFVNGELKDSSQATVSVFDHGFLYGDGVFDTMFARHGYVFKLEQHVARFRRSLTAIKLDIGFANSELSRAILLTAQRNHLRDGYIKIIATRGVTPEPLLDPRGARPTVIVFARPYLISLSTPEQETIGLRAKVVSIRRVPPSSLDPRVKSLNYLNLIMAKIEALHDGYDEALLLDERGFVCEASGYNVFAVRDRVVRTPATSVLEGITRETVLELCEELGIETRVEDLRPSDVTSSDEVFLTSTAGGLIPVVTIGGEPIGPGSPGPMVTRLREAYEDLLRSGRYGTPIVPDNPGSN